MKVESFELTDPLGNKNIFAKFEDGLVFYKFPGTTSTSLWWTVHISIVSLHKFWRVSWIVEEYLAFTSFQ